MQLQGYLMKVNKMLLLSIVIFSISEGSEFVIKLASYANKGNLVKQVALLDAAVKDDVYIIQKKNLYKLFSKPSPSRSHAMMKLPLFRKIFQDAYITAVTYKNRQSEATSTYVNTVKESNTSLESTSDNAPYIKKYDGLLTPVMQNGHKESLVHMLSGKTFYLCPHTINSNKEKFLIEAVFDKDSMSYNTLVGNIPSVKMHYAIKNEKLYFVLNNMINPSQYSKLEKVFFEYYVISKWSRGRKMDQMRYYGKKEDAKSYLDSLIF